MKRIPLTGKYAVGKYTYALVDDKDFIEISKYSWKAKPNANKTHVYAVRNVRSTNGRTHMLRMHREILGVPYDGVLDIDHRNRCGTDNCRSNLRLVSRSENIKNTTETIRLARIVQIKLASTFPRSKLRKEPRPQFVKIEFTICEICRQPMRKKKKNQRFCSERCRHKAHPRHRPKKELGTIICIVCSKPFRKKQPNQIACSQVCKQKRDQELRLKRYCPRL